MIHEGLRGGHVEKEYGNKQGRRAGLASAGLQRARRCGAKLGPASWAGWRHRQAAPKSPDRTAGQAARAWLSTVSDLKATSTIMR